MRLNIESGYTGIEFQGLFLILNLKMCVNDKFCGSNLIPLVKKYKFFQYKNSLNLHDTDSHLLKRISNLLNPKIYLWTQIPTFQKYFQ